MKKNNQIETINGIEMEAMSNVHFKMEYLNLISFRKRQAKPNLG